MLFGFNKFRKRQAEREIERSGIDYTIIRPGGLKSKLADGETSAGQIVMKVLSSHPYKHTYTHIQAHIFTHIKSNVRWHTDFAVKRSSARRAKAHMECLP